MILGIYAAINEELLILFSRLGKRFHCSNADFVSLANGTFEYSQRNISLSHFVEIK